MMKPIGEHIRYGLALLQSEVHATAREKGWYDEDRSLPELIALMHSELSEALECYRTEGDPVDGSPLPLHYADDGKPLGFASELADCVIRILDTAEYLGIDLGKVLWEKHEYNKTRPYRHGGKRA